MQKTADKHIVVMIFSMVIFGTIGLVRRYIQFPSAFIAGVRGIGGALFLLAINRHPDTAAVKKDLRLLICSGIAMGIDWVLFLEGQRYTSIAVATMAYYTSPIMIILLAPVILNEKFTKQIIFATILAVMGVVFLAGKADNASMKGIVISLIAAVFYSVVVFLTKKLRYSNGLDASIIQVAVAGAVALTYSFCKETLPENPTSESIIFLIVLAVVHTGIAYAFYFTSLPKISAQHTAITSFIDPLVAVLCSVVILAEPMTVQAAIGCILITAAIVLSLFRELKTACAKIASDF